MIAQPLGQCDEGGVGDDRLILAGNVGDGGGDDFRVKATYRFPFCTAHAGVMSGNPR